MLIAQITDLHLRPRGLPAYRVSETNAMAARLVEALNALLPRPDLVVITGDLADNGLPEEYAVLAALLGELAIEARFVPGNHDDRAALRAALPGRPEFADDPEFVGFVHESGPVRVVGLDTLVPGASHGALCARRLRALGAALARDDRPTVVAMHHPPFRTGLRAMDAIGLLEGAEALAALLARHPNVERVVCGHHHRPVTARYGGTIAQVAPAASHQVRLDLREDGPTEALLVLEPPAYLLHLWTPAAGLVSHAALVERFPGPFPFVLDAAYPGSPDGGRR